MTIANLELLYAIRATSKELVDYRGKLANAEAVAFQGSKDTIAAYKEHITILTAVLAQLKKSASLVDQ